MDPEVFRRRVTEVSSGPDPLRFCVAATVSAIAWIIGPWLALMLFSGVGVSAYARARRAGQLRSRCLLGDTRWVLAYLGALFVAGTVGLVYRLVD
jgi:hypothetical protein